MSLFRNALEPWPLVYRECSPDCRVCRALAHAAAHPDKNSKPREVIAR